MNTPNRSWWPAPSLVCLLLAGVVGALPQEPQPQQEPQPSPSRQAPVSAQPEEPQPQPPEPAPPGKPAPHPWEGVYALRKRFVDGRLDAGAYQGYLAITRRHLFLTMAAATTADAPPLVQATAREWRPGAATTQTVILFDCWTDADGEIHLEQPGQVEERRIEPYRGGLRVIRGRGEWMEFERIE